MSCKALRVLAIWLTSLSLVVTTPVGVLAQPNPASGSPSTPIRHLVVIFQENVSFDHSAPNETGWKDTVQAHPGMVTRIITRFDDYPGRYVWHCHILEHEDNEMMRPFEILGT